MVQVVGIRGIAELAGGELRHVFHPAYLPHSPVAESEAGAHHIVSTNHKSSATVLGGTILKVFIVRNGHTRSPFSLAAEACRGRGSLAYHRSVVREGGSGSISFWRVQMTGSPCETVSGVIGLDANVGGNPYEVNHL